MLPSSTPRSRRQHGFSLIEAVLALGVCASIGAITLKQIADQREVQFLEDAFALLEAARLGTAAPGWASRLEQRSNRQMHVVSEDARRLVAQWPASGLLCAKSVMRFVNAGWQVELAGELLPASVDGSAVASQCHRESEGKLVVRVSSPTVSARGRLEPGWAPGFNSHPDGF